MTPTASAVLIPPCPFCGAPAELAKNGDAARCSFHTGWLPLSEWNRRAAAMQKSAAVCNWPNCRCEGITHPRLQCALRVPTVEPGGAAAAPLLDWLKSLEACVRYGTTLNKSDLPMIERVRALVAGQPGAAAMRDACATEAVPDDVRVVLALHHRAVDESGSIAFVERLETEGWVVKSVSPDEHSGWTRVVLIRAAALAPATPRATEAPLFDAAVEGMLEGLRDNPAAFEPASIAGIASAALKVITARHRNRATEAELLRLAEAWVAAAVQAARDYPDHRIPSRMIPEAAAFRAALAGVRT